VVNGQRERKGRGLRGSCPHAVACSPCFAILTCKQTTRKDRLEIRLQFHKRQPTVFSRTEMQRYYRQTIPTGTSSGIGKGMGKEMGMGNDSGTGCYHCKHSGKLSRNRNQNYN